MGGEQEIIIENRNYLFDVSFLKEKDEITILNSNIHGKIKYCENEHFKRKGNDLIGEFVYSKERKGEKIDIPYPYEKNLKQNYKL